MALEWWSIEVLDGVFPASQWRRAHDEWLTEAALTHGAVHWDWQTTPWGVVFEVAFRELEQWIRFRDLPGVRATLDAVPDPVNGLLVYPGRAGGTGSRMPRRPGPRPAAGAAPLPESVEDVRLAPARHSHPPSEAPDVRLVSGS